MQGIRWFFKRFGALKGRATRREWLAVMFVSVAVLVGYLIAVFFSFRTAGFDLAVDQPNRVEFWAGAFYISGICLFGPFAWWFSFATSVRRLHDSGKSGLMLLCWLIPFIGWLINLITLLVNGDWDWNAYGPNPRHKDQVALAEQDAADEAKRLARDGPVRRQVARAVISTQASSSTSQ